MASPGVENIPLQRWRKLGLILVSTLLIAGGLLWYFAPKERLVPGKLYRYYPKTTQGYLEARTGEKTGQRLLSWLAEAHRFPVLPPTLPMGSSLKLLPLSAVEKLDQLKALSQMTLPPLVPGGTTVQKLSQHYSELFQPYLALGFWETETSQAPRQLLLILPLKAQGLSIDTLLTTLQENPAEYQAATTLGIPYWVQTKSTLALCPLKSVLLVASSPQAMEQALQQSKGQETPLLEQPMYGKYLAKLPAPRQGTFLLNVQQISQPHQAKRLHQFAVLSPFILGGLETKADQILKLSFYAPLNLRWIVQPTLRQDMGAFLNQTLHFQSAQYLPAQTPFFVSTVGLDKAWDLYTHLSQNQSLQSQLKAYRYLLAPLRIDFRKDLVGLLEGELAMAYLPDASVREPVVLLSNTKAKEATLNKLTQLLSLSIFPIVLKSEQMGSVSVQTLALTKSLRGFQNLQVSFAPLDQVLAFASSSGLSRLIEIKDQVHPSLASQPFFQTLKAQLPQEGLGMGYIDLSRHASGKVIQGVAATARIEDQSCVQGTVAVKLNSP